MTRPAFLMVVLLSACGRTAPYELVADALPAPLPAVPCGFGALHGSICAPDGRTFVNGATASVDAFDCHGAPVQVQATSGADGAFMLEGVPAGTWEVNATLGRFSQSTLATVTAGQVNELPTRGLCVAQRNVKIAVVSGNGDKIERLLGDLKLTHQLFAGTPGKWPNDGAIFLSDLEKMKTFDFIFIDCAAASPGGYVIDFGQEAARIEQNLHDYVLSGGTLYASDWGALFAHFAAPGALELLTDVPTPLEVPFNCNHLMGFAPDVVQAHIADSGLSTFLGTDSIPINFPDHGNTVTLHWGLLGQAPGATVLVSADQVATCGDLACDAAGPLRDGVPLAVKVKLTPPEARGGTVVYTAFHNVAQTGDGVARMIKYLVLTL